MEPADIAETIVILMRSIVRASERFHSNEDWLNTYWHFSFGNYYDRSNMGWGALRVFNDDRIAVGGKFDLHPHANYEIMTVMLDGELEHTDSAGHKGILSANGVQAMSAASGVFHSEAQAGAKRHAAGRAHRTGGGACAARRGGGIFCDGVYSQAESAALGSDFRLLISDF